jgi:hypothetical protein
MAFYALVVQRAEPGSAVAQAFSGGMWQFKAAASLCAFAALAALAMRAFGMAVEYGALERAALPPAPAGGQSVAEVDELLAELDAAPRTFDATYLGRRLRRALTLVRQRGTAESLEAHLHALSADDRRAVADRSAGVRALTVAVPLIGGAGVAAGIAASLHAYALNPAAQAMPAMLSGIALACSGLVQAIGLAVAVVVARLAVERSEQRLLAEVDAATERALVGRFAALGTERDPHLGSVQKMCAQLLATVEGAAERQDAALGQSLAAATRRWEEMASTAGVLLHRTLSEALATGLAEHAHAITGGIAKFADDLQNTVVRHAQILSDNIDQHTEALDKSLERLTAAVAAALGRHAEALAASLDRHTVVIAETEQSLAAENKRWLGEMEAALGEALLLNASRQEKLIQTSEDLLKEMQVALVEAAGMSVAQQEQLIKQSDVLLRVVDATGQVRKLEEALNGNLLALSTSHNFEQTVTSLAAAVQLLSVRLRQPAIVRNEIDLTGDDTTSQAA